jgi:Holliday junction DNA helicase RuvA
MISFIKGTVDSLTLSSAVIDNNGIGYEVFVTPGTLSRLRLNEQIKLFTHFQVKEDGMTLFGFWDREELNMFTMLISVSGIGAKSAMNMLSHAGPRDLMLAIIADDINAMSKFPGIGKKTAARLILELKDKIKSKDSEGYDLPSSDTITESGQSPKGDAISALVSLGYSRSEAVKAVISVADEDMEAQQIIRLALKTLSGGNR